VGGQPRQGALDDPAFRQRVEALLAVFLADDLDGGLQDGRGELDQPAGEAAVGEQVPTRRSREVVVKQELAGTVAVLAAGGQHEYTQQQTERVDDDEPLAAVDLLARVIATGGAGDSLVRLEYWMWSLTRLAARGSARVGIIIR